MLPRGGAQTLSKLFKAPGFGIAVPADAFELAAELRRRLVRAVCEYDGRADDFRRGLRAERGLVLALLGAASLCTLLQSLAFARADYRRLAHVRKGLGDYATTPAEQARFRLGAQARTPSTSRVTPPRGRRSGPLSLSSPLSKVAGLVTSALTLLALACALSRMLIVQSYGAAPWKGFARIAGARTLFCTVRPTFGYYQDYFVYFAVRTSSAPSAPSARAL